MFAATSLCRRPGAAVSGRELSTRPRARASTACTRGARVQAVATATAADAPATAPSLPYRVGHGWDLHRLEEGYPLIIGGIDIPHVVGCVAHSDGDVLLHTVVDAVLGALCLPDIGQLFPDNDPQWKGARSDIFLKEAVCCPCSVSLNFGVRTFVSINGAPPSVGRLTHLCAPFRYAS
mmetsp:Transcript_38007/g.96169  ORF Transcript_38007/g.96169 Transcript_38007/m.96169 type:complete len:178 (+) Transcript_38007:93-626(+)